MIAIISSNIIAIMLRLVATKRLHKISGENKRKQVAIRTYMFTCEHVYTTVATAPYLYCLPSRILTGEDTKASLRWPWSVIHPR